MEERISSFWAETLGLQSRFVWVKVFGILLEKKPLPAYNFVKHSCLFEILSLALSLSLPLRLALSLSLSLSLAFLGDVETMRPACSNL